MKRGSFGELREGKATPISSPQGSTRGDRGAAEAEALGCQTESWMPPAGGRGSWQGRCGSWGRPETTALRSSVRRPPGRGPDPRGKGVRAAGGRAGPWVLCPPQGWRPRAPRLRPSALRSPPRPLEPHPRPPPEPARGGAAGSNRRFLSLPPVTHRHCSVRSG